jgi:hypothetical protein
MTWDTVGCQGITLGFCAYRIAENSCCRIIYGLNVALFWTFAHCSFRNQIIIHFVLYVDHNTELDSWPLKITKYATPVLHHTGQWTHDSVILEQPQFSDVFIFEPPDLLFCHFSILKEATDSSHILAVLSNTCCLYSYPIHWGIIVILIKFMSKI